SAQPSLNAGGAADPSALRRRARAAGWWLTGPGPAGAARPTSSPPPASGLADTGTRPAARGSRPPAPRHSPAPAGAAGEPHPSGRVLSWPPPHGERHRAPGHHRLLVLGEPLAHLAGHEHEHAIELPV